MHLKRSICDPDHVCAAPMMCLILRANEPETTCAEFSCLHTEESFSRDKHEPKPRQIKLDDRSAEGIHGACAGVRRYCCYQKRHASRQDSISHMNFLTLHTSAEVRLDHVFSIGLYICIELSDSSLLWAVPSLR